MNSGRTAASLILGAVLFAALRLCAQTPASRQRQIQEHTELASKYVAENKPAAAAAEYRSIIELDPNNADARGNLGVLLFAGGQYADANVQLRAALRLEPNLWKIQALLGMSERRTGDASEAETDLNGAFTHLTNKKIRVECGLELIELDYSLRDLDEAASVVGVLRKLEPESPEISYAAYRVYSELTTETMLSLGLVAPKSPQMHLIMAHEMARQSNVAGAIAQYRIALHMDPKLPGVHFELAEELTVSQDPTLQAQAEGEYKAALAVNRFDEKSNCKLAEILMKQGDMKQAAAYYTTALKLSPGDPEANVGLAGILILKNQKQKALPLLENAVNEDPSNTVALYRLSLLYRQDGETAKANEELAKFQQYSDLRKGLQHLFEEMRIHSSQVTAASTLDDVTGGSKETIK